ncbi:MAG: TetR/AcrR family transcriptional regulator [Acidimicrobiia bacterium]
MVTRERLIEASIDLFSHHGFDGTSLTSIAEKAGVTQPTLNYHFGTKRQLYRDVIRHCGSQWVAAAQVGDLQDLGQLDVLRVVMRRLGQVIVGQHVTTRLILQASMHPKFEGEVEEALRPGVEALTALLEDLMAAGTLRGVPPYVFISMFVDVLITNASVDRVKGPLYGQDFSDPAVLSTLIDNLIDILLAGTMQTPPENG